MIVLALAALLAAQQTIVVPTTSVAPSQALPATASSPQIKAPDPATTPSGDRAPAAATPVVPITAAAPTPPQATAAGRASSSSAALNIRDRTALPTAQASVGPSSGLPAGVTGGPVFGGPVLGSAASVQPGGHP